MNDKKYQDEEWLREQVTEKGKTFSEIAEELGVGQSTVHDWGRKLDIEFDAKTHNWRGKRKQTLKYLEEQGIL